MYAISNQQREEIIKLLAALQDLPDKDTKTINIKRRAVILTRKLNNKKQIDNDTKLFFRAIMGV